MVAKIMHRMRVLLTGAMLVIALASAPHLTGHTLAVDDNSGVGRSLAPRAAARWPSPALVGRGDADGGSAVGGLRIRTLAAQPALTVDPGAESGSDQELQSEIERYLAGRSGVYGLAVYDFGSGRTVLLNSNRVFPSASTYKLLVMYCVFRNVERGSLSLDDEIRITAADAIEDIEPDGGVWPETSMTIRSALESMITVSSNTAAYALVRSVGGWGEIDRASSALGMGQTRLNGLFETSPSDMLRFLVLLDQGQLGSKTTTQQMIDLLSRQTVNDRLPALLPADARVAHKTGELPGVRNDVGLVYAPSGRIAIAAFSERASVEDAVDVIAQTSLRVYQRYTLSGGGE